MCVQCVCGGGGGSECVAAVLQYVCAWVGLYVCGTACMCVYCMQVRVRVFVLPYSLYGSVTAT